MTEFKQEDIKHLNKIIESVNFDDAYVITDIKDILGFKELSQLDFEYYVKILNDYDCIDVEYENTKDIYNTCIYKNGNTSYFIKQGGFERVFKELEKEKSHKNNTFFSLKNAKLKHYLFIPTTILAFIGGLKTLYDWTKNDTTDKSTTTEQKTIQNKSELKDIKSDSTFVFQKKTDKSKTD
ncbi:hypothetical protein [Lutibacter maritimus]|uniref:Uncharacterized protein n=1 Tax=Lutibacter maritimus TaxID=593133 RepID=A0A1I6SVZ0_9FLAO|nr:hypothetical protein [Lutibacter maritimus]SFS81033.1 hypothetical protein SAMN04488006_0153 [Lutibacter maritimus]